MLWLLVGKKAANTLELNALLGKVFEGVQDRSGRYPGGSGTDPPSPGPSASSLPVHRGESQSRGFKYCRSALFGMLPSRHLGFLGFRLVRIAPKRKALSSFHPTRCKMHIPRGKPPGGPVIPCRHALLSQEDVMLARISSMHFESLLAALDEALLRRLAKGRGGIHGS